MTDPSGGSTSARRPVAVPALALVAITVIGVTALLGGLDEVSDAPEQLSQGAVLDQGRYTTRFVESRVTVVRAETQFDEDKRFVEMVFDVTNTGDDTAPVGVPPAKAGSALGAGFANSLIKIDPPVPEDAESNAFTQSNKSRLLHPGTTNRVIVRYALKDGQKPPAKLTLDVAAFEYVAGFNDPWLQWNMVTDQVGDKHVPEIKARVTLPVKAGEGT